MTRDELLKRYAKGEIDFRGADLTWTNLAGANLTWANLRRANLTVAVLEGANLAGAHLTVAVLEGANLRRANLTVAVLEGARLARANLAGANLTGASLTGADLTGANLSGANLTGANLTGAKLTGAKLAGANLTGAKLPPFQIPQEGELIVWKKLRVGVICKLRIPPDAKRTASLIGRKCRAEYAEVLEGEGVSLHEDTCKYAQGEIVRPHEYDDDIRVECTGGIHFFLTREEAEAY